MAELKYFTLAATAKTVVADETGDADYDPQVKGIYSGVTITPTVKNTAGKAITWVRATGLAQPELIVVSPVRARIDNGNVVLRIAPDKPVDDYANLAAFPGTGLTTKYYRALDTDKMYAWNGTTYVETYAWAPIRLLAKCSALGADVASIRYRIDFFEATFNGQPQTLPSIEIEAPTIADDDTSETTVNLATAAWL